tara:strand:- start:32 stop:490 length:459 start_codon:yes stop_codon:yes gene_type:complete
MKKDLNIDSDRIAKDGVKIYTFDEVKKIVEKVNPKTGKTYHTIENTKPLLNGDIVLFPVGYGKDKIRSKSQKDMIAITVNDIWAKEIKVQSRAFMVIWNLFESLSKAKNFKQIDEFISKTVVNESKSMSLSEEESKMLEEFRKQKANGTNGQ